jgi:signal transduction histidine kinase
VNVELKMDGDFDALPDRYRTCLYRAVQEALTNCVRHAQAGSIIVSLTGEGDQISVVVTDDGVGIDTTRRDAGLGLRGIEERVKELHGAMTIEEAEGGGTRLAIHLPWPTGSTEVPLARAAG